MLVGGVATGVGLVVGGLVGGGAGTAAAGLTGKIVCSCREWRFRLARAADDHKKPDDH